MKKKSFRKKERERERDEAERERERGERPIKEMAEEEVPEGMMEELAGCVCPLLGDHFGPHLHKEHIFRNWRKNLSIIPF